MLDFSLTAEQKELQQKARAFALKEVLPVAWYYDEQDEIPMKVLRKAYNAGMIGSDIPEEFGGQGLTLLDSALITEEWNRSCCHLMMLQRKNIFQQLLKTSNWLPLPHLNRQWVRTWLGFAVCARWMVTTIFSTAPNTGSPTVV